MKSAKSKNKKLLFEFTCYCANHPEFRFWQSLRSWAGVNKILVEVEDKEIDDFVLYDTFCFKGRNK